MIGRAEFSECLRDSVVGTLQEFREGHPSESPYGFAVIESPFGDYLDWAIATEEGLRRTAEEYDRLGYRYQGWEWEDFDNVEMLAVWLRWANPDDGWHRGEFPEPFHVTEKLTSLVEAGAFGDELAGFEEFCTEALGSLQVHPRWLSLQANSQIVVGVTAGKDPRDFLRTATRCNPYPLVYELWSQFINTDELSSRIRRPE